MRKIETPSEAARQGALARRGRSVDRNYKRPGPRRTSSTS
jgi:hypothetical protein